jgi:hypothetical protein
MATQNLQKYLNHIQKKKSHPRSGIISNEADLMLI